MVRVLFTTQTLGLNPEVLEPNIIERLNDRFDILQNKKMQHICFIDRL
jgi:hypothetical protein